MTLDFLTGVLSIPTCSGHEEFFAECIEGWCKTAGVKVSKDGAGNMYLVKGSPKSGEFYPGATAHIDTVQHMQEPYISAKRLMDPKVDGDKITMWMEDDRGQTVQTGTGSDDKNAVAIILSLFTRVPCLKAAFFVKEEVGMVGSKASDMSFWDDVAWVFGCDSPGPDSRATEYTSGVRLFDDGFFNDYLRPICAKHGVTDWRSEPYTDLATLHRRGGEKGFICSCNISNGGENAHQNTEWCSYRKTCDTEELGYELMTTIPLNKRYEMKLTNEPRPQYSGFSGFSGGYSDGYSPWWINGYSASSSAKTPTKTKLARGQFTWKFKTPEASALFGKAVSESKLKVETAKGQDGTTVSGTVKNLVNAFVLAFDADNGTEYKSWNELTAAVPKAEETFEDMTNIDLDKLMSPMEHSSDDMCSFTWPLEDEKTATELPVEFESEIEEIGTPVGIETGKDGITVQGRLRSVKRAWVILQDMVDGTSYRYWPIYAKNDPKGVDEFFDLVEFGEEDDGIEDAEYVMKDEPAQDDIPPVENPESDFWEMFKD